MMQGDSAGQRPKTNIVLPFDAEDEEVQDVASSTESTGKPPSINPVFRRLNRAPLAKKSGSKLKLSFGTDDDVHPLGTSTYMKETMEEETFIPKRSALSKKVGELKKATDTKERKFGLKSYLSSIHRKLTHRNSLPTTPSESTGLTSRPAYTKDYLTQLRDSTPSTPRDISDYVSDESPASSTQPIARPAEILDEAVIRALKERRQDRARGEDYLSLDQEAAAKIRKPDSDDEETYRAYVDEPVRLQKNMTAAQKKYKQDQIQEALYQSDSDMQSSVDDEDDWETQQIAKAQPNLEKKRKRDMFSMPDEIPPIPTFDSVMTRMRARLESEKAKRAQLAELLKQLQKEIEEIKEREETTQENLVKAGREYEELKEDFKATGVNRGLDEVGHFGSTVNMS
jgi:hypothetical protein